MQQLTAPVNRHITGKLPTHSKSGTLASNFKSLDQNALKFILVKAGYLNEDGKPTKAAANAGLLDRCEKTFLWNLDVLEKTLFKLGNPVRRQYANQTLPPMATSEPVWVNLGTLGTHFNVSAKVVGKWIEDLHLKGKDGMATEETLSRGLATVTEMAAGPQGKKTRKINQWNLRPMQELLMKAGHPLDFDYEKSLKGTGKNSDVQVTTIDARAKEFAKEFLEAFNNPETRSQTQHLVRKTPKLIQTKAEALLKRPGFITTGEYLKHLKK